VPLSPSPRLFALRPLLSFSVLKSSSLHLGSSLFVLRIDSVFLYSSLVFDIQHFPFYFSSKQNKNPSSRILFYFNWCRPFDFPQEPAFSPFSLTRLKRRADFSCPSFPTPFPFLRPGTSPPGHPAERRPRRPVPRQGRRRRPPPRRRPRPRRCAPMRGLCVGARVCVCIVFRTLCMFEHVPFRRFHLMFPSPPACVLCRFHAPRRKPGPVGDIRFDPQFAHARLPHTTVLLQAKAPTSAIHPSGSVVVFIRLRSPPTPRPRLRPQCMRMRSWTRRRGGRRCRRPPVAAPSPATATSTTATVLGRHSRWLR